MNILYRYFYNTLLVLYGIPEMLNCLNPIFLNQLGNMTRQSLYHSKQNIAKIVGKNNQN